MDYADIYDIAMAYFAPKRRSLAQLLGRELARQIKLSDQAIVRVADIGSGDGSLMADILEMIPAVDRARLQVTCIEPDDSNFHALTANFNRLAALTDCTLVHDTVESYLVQKPDFRMDVFTMTHMLYHVPQEQWAALLRRVFNATVSGGTGLVTLVDDNSDIYVLSGTDPERANQNPEEATGGGYVFASHLQAVLENLPETKFLKIDNIGPYAIPQEDIDEFCRALDDEALRQCKFTAFLGFLLRVEPQDIVANENLIAAFRAHFATGQPLRSTEGVFKITALAPA